MPAIDVTVQDVTESAFGLTIPDDPRSAVAIKRLIKKATDRVYHAFPNLDRRINSGNLDYDTACGVVEDMVIRVLRNPNATRQMSLDDYSRMIDTSLSSGALYLSDSERDLLTPPRRSGSASGFGAVRLKVPAWRLPGG